MNKRFGDESTNIIIPRLFEKRPKSAPNIHNDESSLIIQFNNSDFFVFVVFDVIFFIKYIYIYTYL